jgi:Transglycosylase-like domain
MKRILYPASIAVLTTAAAVPAAAAAKPTTRAHAHAYEHAYHKVAHQLGARVPGRNIVRLGMPDGRRPSDAQTVSSLGVLTRMLAPASSVTSAAGAAGVPACASESGTDYSTGAANTNPSSGATGRYQILPSTAAAYGCSLATAAGQDACAQVIYEHQGASAWVGCGG